MPGKTTIPLDKDQYINIIKALYDGIPDIIRPNERTALVLETEANTGLRCGDVLNLTLDRIIKDNDGYLLNITEQKTGKKRTFAMADDLYKLLREYATNYSIKENEKLFPISIRAIQKNLNIVCEYLGYSGISTHSFRKFFGMQLYEIDHDIELVKRVYQHSSVAITSRYLGISNKKINKAIRSTVNIVRACNG